MNELNLSPAEAELLDIILSALSKHASSKLTLNYLLTKWNWLVTQIEQGYDGCIYEYTNDLSARDFLEEVCEMASDSLREKILRVVRPIDARFKESTYEIKQPLLPDIEDKYFWWFRIPKKMSQELEEDLRSDGILD